MLIGEKMGRGPEVAMMMMITVFMLSGCIENKDVDIIDDHDIDFQIGPLNNRTLYIANIEDSIIIKNERSNFTIKVIEGEGETWSEKFDLNGKIVKIEEYEIGVFLKPDIFEDMDMDVFEYVGIGDHFSLEMERSYMSGLYRENISVWNEDVLKIRYQRHLGPIDLGPDGIIYPSRSDDLISPFPINGSQLIEHPFQFPDHIGEPGKKAYWSPYLDEMMELNDTEILENGYFLINNDDLHLSSFSYDTYLNFSFDDGSVTFTDSHQMETVTIGENEYYLAVDNLYRETWYESYGVQDVSPARSPNSFHVIRMPK